MPYPFEYKTRLRRPEVLSFEYEKTFTATTANTITLPGNLPPGAYAISMAINVTGTNQPIVLRVAPYVDREQSTTDGSYNFVQTGTSVTVTNITFAATGTLTGAVYGIVPSGDQYGLAAAVITPYGDQFTISSTATAGTIKFGVMAVEV
jgi:hypothetical protein